MENNLENEVGSANWNELGPQLAKDQLIIVSTNLSISEVAGKVAEDDTAAIQQWISEGTIFKPGKKDIEKWQNENPKFICIVVKPFVLAQLPS